MRKTLTILFLTLIALPAHAATLSDINAHRYQSSIEFLQEQGIINGYPDGTFKPDLQLNRAELMKIVIEKDYDELPEMPSCFSDVPTGQWYTSYVCKGKELGIVTGHPNGTFKPNDKVNFVEATAILLRSNGLDIAPLENQSWYEGNVRFAIDINIVPPDITANDAPVTRAQMSEIMTRLIKYDAGELDAYLEINDDIKLSFEDLENGTADIKAAIKAHGDSLERKKDKIVFQDYDLSFVHESSFDFNNLGQVLGAKRDPGYETNRGYVFDHGQFTYMAPINKDKYITPVAINDRGQVTGGAEAYTGLQYQHIAFISNGENVNNTGIVGTGQDISNTGIVVGEYADNNIYSKGFILKDGNVRKLSSRLLVVNDAGQAAGDKAYPDAEGINRYHTFFWDGEKEVYIEPIEGAISSQPRYIAEDGIVYSVVNVGIGEAPKVVAWKDGKSEVVLGPDGEALGSFPSYVNSRGMIPYEKGFYVLGKNEYINLFDYFPEDKSDYGFYRVLAINDVGEMLIMIDYQIYLATLPTNIFPY